MNPDPKNKFAWILWAGWTGHCPRCGKGRMFRSFLKLAERCDVCGLDYRFAAPDDGPAFFAQCFVAFPIIMLIVWFQVVYSPPVWVHLLTSLPILAAGCVLPLRPLKGWLVASQYVNKAQEAGTDSLWAELNARQRPAEDDGRD